MELLGILGNSCGLYSEVLFHWTKTFDYSKTWQSAKFTSIIRSCDYNGKWNAS